MPKSFNGTNFLLITSFLIIFSSSFVSAIPTDSGSPLTHTTEVNYSNVTVYNTTLWDGHAWSDTRWLDIDGGNANTNINIGTYTFTANGLRSSGDILPTTDAGINIGTGIARINQIFLYGDLSNGRIGGDINVTEMVSAYTHSNDNSQAHSDYLKNDANDIQQGYLSNRGLYPSTTSIYDIGQPSLFWRNLYLNGRLFADATTNVSVAEMKTAYQWVTNGSFLTSLTETDPLWTANYTLYNASWSNMTNSSYLTEVLGDESYINIVSGNNVTFNETKLNDALASTTYYLNNSAVTGGSYTDTSDVTDAWYYDSLSLNFTEGNGVSPLDIYLNFTGVDDFSQLIIREYYLGSASHMIQVQIWDVDSSTWEDYFEFVGQAGFTILTIPVYDPDEHITPDGNVSIRLHHIQNGVTSHRVYIDFAWLVDGTNVGGSTNLDGYAKYNFGFNNFSGSGNVTANYFFGNGSQLTGISAGTTDHSALDNLAWSVSGHTIDDDIDMNDNQITDMSILLLSGGGYIGDWGGELLSASNFTPVTTMYHDLGSPTNRWLGAYVGNLSSDYVDATSGITTLGYVNADSLNGETLKVNGSSYMNDTLNFNNPFATKVVSDGLLRVRGNWSGATIFSLMSFKPIVTAGNLYGFHISPTMSATDKIIYGIYQEPLFASNVNQKFVGNKIMYPASKNNYNDTLSIIEEVSTRSAFNTNGWTTIDDIKIGNSFFAGNIGGGERTFVEKMITLTGGVTEIVSVTKNPTQIGLNFVGFQNKGLVSTIEMIHSTGGDINIQADNSHYYTGASKDVDMYFDGTNYIINMTTDGAVTITNSTGLGKIRALEYATSTPKDSDYSIDDKYVDDLPSPENLLDEDGKIIRGALPLSQTTYLETDYDNCWEEGTGEYWYCYDVVGTEAEHCSYTPIKDNKDLIKEKYVEIMRTECGKKPVNVTLIDTQAFENTIMVSELNQKIKTLEAEQTRIKNCLASSRDFNEYKICVGGILTP